MQQILKKHYENKLYYVDFEDERFVKFTTQDFNLLYEVLIELYGLKHVFFSMRSKILKAGNFLYIAYTVKKIKFSLQDQTLLY